MLKKMYIDGITGILHFLNYNKLENEHGNSRVPSNIADIVLALSYTLISFSRLKEVTDLVFYVNLIVLLRLIIINLKGSLNLRDKYEEVYRKRPGLLFKSAYDIKLIIEFCIIGFVLIPFWLLGAIFEDYVIQVFVGIIIFVSFLENVINVFVELFKASIDIELM